jgi:prepilin peptidase CpaA
MFDNFLIDKNFIHDSAMVMAGLIMLAAAFSDFKKLRISNRLCLALAALFPVFVWSSPTEIAWVQHLAIAAAVMAVGFGMFAMRLLGGGDVKMLAAAALWAGPKLIGALLLYTTFAGGLLAIAFACAALVRVMVLHKKPVDGQPWHKIPVPYGIAIACGGISALVMLAQSNIT